MSRVPEGSPLDLELEWNESKRQPGLEERRIDFREAVRLFDDPVLETLSRHPAKTRWAAVGIVDGKEIAVVYAVSHSRRKIITAWRAGTHERRE